MLLIQFRFSVRTDLAKYTHARILHQNNFYRYTEKMYSDYGRVGVDCEMLHATLRHCQMMRQPASMTGDWLCATPTSTPYLVGDWRKSIRQVHKWRPIEIEMMQPAMETTQCQPLNLHPTDDKPIKSSPCCGRRSPDMAAVRRGSTRRRFDFTRLAESATKRDHSPTTDDDTPSSGVKVAKYDSDQSDRRLPLKPTATTDKTPLLWSLPRHSTLPPLKSVSNLTESQFDRYTSSALFDDKITPTSV